MRTLLRGALIALGLVAALTSRAANWPAWRGPLGTGLCEERNLPTVWRKTQHVKWRTPLPEGGNSTPIIWGNRVFVSQAEGARRTLICFDRNSGEKLWQVGTVTKEKEPTHETNPYCAGSPVTDGERVIVSFASDGLFCYDFEGKELWSRTDLGRQVHIWGGGPSPMIMGEWCFFNFGPGETTYLLAVDKRTGRTVWKQVEETGYNKKPTPDASDPTFIGSWTTPTVMKVEGKDQLLMSWPRRLAGIDPATGKEIWRCTGLNPLVYTSPIYENGVVVSMGGYSGMAIAVRAGGAGDVTGERRLWHHAKSPQRIGSGAIHDGHIYVHNDPGTAMCINLKSGETVWTERLKGPGPSGVNWSSVMIADGLCYTINQGGDCFVFKASPKFELVSTNPLGERSNSSIAASDGELFIRTHAALWCIARPK